MGDVRWLYLGTAIVLVHVGCNCGGSNCDDDGCIVYDPTTSTSLGEEEDDDVGPGDTAGPESASADEVSASESSSGGPEDQCQSTEACDGLFCVAPYADNHRGAFACVADCVGPMDEAVWCFDDAACCDPVAHCTIRGYCEIDGATSSMDDGGSTSGATGTSAGGTGTTGDGETGTTGG